MLIDLTDSENARFESKLSPPNASGCVIWNGTIASTGYGCFWLRRRSHLAHRISVMRSGRDIPDGRHIDHLCRTPACVNPDHLEVVTPRENHLRGVGFGALNVIKTHCPKGHALEDGNLDAYAMKSGRRACQECMRERCRVWHHKNRDARLEKMLSYRAARKQGASL